MVDWCFIPSGPGAGGWRKKYKNNGNLSGFHRVVFNLWWTGVSSLVARGEGERGKYKNNGNLSGFHRVALPSTVFRSNRNLEMLVFVEGGKLENPEKNP